MGVLLMGWDIFILLFLHSSICGYKLKLKRVLISILSFMLLFGLFHFSVNALGWHTYYLLLFHPSFFLLYTHFTKRVKNNWLLLIFYAVFPITFWVVVLDFVLHFIVYNSNLLYTIYETTYGGIIFSNIACLIILLFLKIFQYDFSHLKQKVLDKRTRWTLRIANFSLLFYYVIIPSITYIEELKGTTYENQREMIIAIYFILFICFVNILDRNLRQELQEQVILQKEIQLQNINNYSKQVEGLYQEIRSFRHDYANILTSLKLGIDKKDLQLISDIYDSVLKESGKTLKGERFEVARLVNVQDLPLKSLLLSKLSEAQSLSIPISLEVEAPIAISHIEQIDLLTIVSILLDNALEAAAEAGDKANLAVCLFEDRRLNKQVLIIQNATAEREVDLARIFERGVSSKVGERGLGLANVTDILKAYPNISLRTTSQHFTFTQVLEIEP